MLQARPMAGPGLRVGLLGGSFNPPHHGHLLISEVALRRLRLDRVWWLISPGNPLKSSAPASLAQRADAAGEIISDPRIIPTSVETVLGTRYTHDTLRALRRRYGGVRFVWLMGEDNLEQFHRWFRWQDIMRSIPVAVFSRPGTGFPALNSRAARHFAAARLPAEEAGTLAARSAPCWTLLTHPMSGMSSTRLRAAGGWP